VPETATDSRLRHFPVSFFAMVMGLTGFTLVLERGVRLWGLPRPLAWATLALSVALFVVLAAFYATKVLRHGVEVVAEFRHPVRLSFFPAITISLILLGIALLDVNLDAARFLWFTGALGHLVLTLLVVSAWINRTTFEVQHTNPAWFIPVVGNILVPIGGVALGVHEVSWFYFSIGVVFWLVLLTLIFNRVIFHHPLPERLMPTLFILIAPPAVGFLAYTRLTGHLDVFARVLYYSALFLTLVLATQYRSFARLKFYLSWWAYSFPLAAMTLATMHMFQHTGYEFFRWLAAALAIALTAIIALLVTLTVRAAARNQICVPEG
jgi:tellurite resistance protein